MLQALPPEEHIILAWWEHSQFTEIPEDQWPAAAESVEDELDWSRTHDAMGAHMELWLSLAPLYESTT